LKGYKVLISFIVTGTMLVGCQSTSEKMISSDNQLFKYQSRCLLHDAELANVDATAKKTDVVVLSRIPPKYPLEAIKSKIEGYSKMEFDISSEGRPININVIESYPKRLFNSAAKSALSGWKYEGKKGLCQTVTIEFAMG
jgi:TonB family protein